MRIVYLTHYGELYGANRSMLDLVVEGRERHGLVPFVIAAREGPLLDRLTALHIPHAVVGFQPWMEKRHYMGGPHHKLMQWLQHIQAGRARASTNRRAVQEVAEYCRTWAVELIHVNSSVIGIGQDLAGRLSVPWIWHMRELHRQHYGFAVDGGLGRFANALRKANVVIAPSKAVAFDVNEIAGPNVRMELIPNGVLFKEQRRELEAKAGTQWQITTPFRFALVGVFHPAKGQLEAVEALARVRSAGVDATLVLAGSGRSGTVEERIAQLGMAANITLPGFVEDPHTIYQSVHCVLNCSRHEAFGRTTLEAMANGLPVIGHASGATVELIKPGVNGMLYSTLDELVTCMGEMARDPEAGRALGVSAMATLPDQALVETMAAATVRVYCKLLGRPVIGP